MREHEQPEHDEEGDLGDEGDSFVEGDEVAPVARRRAPDSQADEIDGEEAAAADHLRRAKRDGCRGERSDGGECTDRLWDAAEQPRCGRTESHADRKGSGRGRRFRPHASAWRHRTRSPQDRPSPAPFRGRGRRRAPAARCAPPPARPRCSPRESRPQARGRALRSRAYLRAAAAATSCISPRGPYSRPRRSSGVFTFASSAASSSTTATSSRSSARRMESSPDSSAGSALLR